MTLRLEQCHQNWLINLSVLYQAVSGEGYLHQKVSNYVNRPFYYRPNDKSTISKAVVAYAYEVWDEVEAQCTIRERFVTR